MCKEHFSKSTELKPLLDNKEAHIVGTQMHMLTAVTNE